MSETENGFDPCKQPGCCTCDLPRCPVCGYTRHDASHHMDHKLCAGTIPLNVAPSVTDATEVEPVAYVRECFKAAIVEGLYDRLSDGYVEAVRIAEDNRDRSIWGLVERRLMPAYEALCASLEAAPRASGVIYTDLAKMEHEAEEAECARMALDDLGAPKVGSEGEYSLVGRIMRYGEMCAAAALRASFASGEPSEPLVTEAEHAAALSVWTDIWQKGGTSRRDVIYLSLEAAAKARQAALHTSAPEPVVAPEFEWQWRVSPRYPWTFAISEAEATNYALACNGEYRRTPALRASAPESADASGMTPLDHEARAIFRVLWGHQFGGVAAYEDDEAVWKEAAIEVRKVRGSFASGEQSDEWRPIATAPKDGTWFLAAWQDTNGGMNLVSWQKGWRIESCACGLPPTHWRPLPAPPIPTPPEGTREGEDEVEPCGLPYGACPGMHQGGGTCPECHVYVAPTNPAPAPGRDAGEEDDAAFFAWADLQWSLNRGQIQRLLRIIARRALSISGPAEEGEYFWPSHVYAAVKPFLKSDAKFEEVREAVVIALARLAQPAWPDDGTVSRARGD